MLVRICDKDYSIRDIKFLRAKDGFIIVTLRNKQEDYLKFSGENGLSAEEYLQQIHKSLQILTYTFGSRGGCHF